MQTTESVLIGIGGRKMSSEKIRAYCPVCRKLVTDDLIDDKNLHQHPVVIMRVMQTVEPGDKFVLFEMTPASYLKEASRLDAELIVGRIMSRYNIPLPRNIFRGVVEEMLRILRELAIEEEKKEREKLAKAKSRKRLPAKKVGKEEPLT